MKFYLRIFFLGILFLGSTVPVFCQGFGIDASSPNTKLDVNGDVAMRIGAYTASNGNNNNINVGAFSFIRISGPGSPYTITGISGGVNGKIIILFNSTSFDMTIGHERASSTASNRIIGADNVDVVVKQKGCAMLIYSSTDSRWIVVSIYKS